jgi:hypothetical protein
VASRALERLLRAPPALDQELLLERQAAVDSVGPRYAADAVLACLAQEGPGPSLRLHE